MLFSINSKLSFSACIAIALMIVPGCSRGPTFNQAPSDADQVAAEQSADGEVRSAGAPVQPTQSAEMATAAPQQAPSPQDFPASNADAEMAITAEREKAFESQPAATLSKSVPQPKRKSAQRQPQMRSQAMRAEAAVAPEPVAPLPAGAQRNSEQGFATVQVFYATDRQRSHLPLSAYEVTGQKHLFMMLGGASLLFFVFSAFSWLGGRTRMGTLSAVAGCAGGICAAAVVTLGQANIEKHGVTYTGDRGTLTRGICEVTVPDTHRRGIVERPSLLRFEIHEDQHEHLVLTSAVELATNDFQQRLSETVSSSPEGDLLVFIHGFNVDFQSAVRRTAQIAVDLPFEGVPVCYSWPSQGTLMGYPVDETNAAWTTTHLKQFLLELATNSGARSINVVAHSMGNRPMTGAMEQIRWQLDDESPAPFDRIILAAPDVDADRFRRDLAPSLLDVADQVTLYASSDDQALIASKQVHGYPRAGESGANVVVVPGVETIDVSGIDLSLLGHSYYGDNESMLRELYEVVRARLPAPRRAMLIPLRQGELIYWQLAQRSSLPNLR